MGNQTISSVEQAEDNECDCRFFSHYFGNMTRTLEFGIFCVAVYKLGKTHTTLYDQIKQINQIFG